MKITKEVNTKGFQRLGLAILLIISIPIVLTIWFAKSSLNYDKSGFSFVGFVVLGIFVIFVGLAVLAIFLATRGMKKAQPESLNPAKEGALALAVAVILSGLAIETDSSFPSGFMFRLAIMTALLGGMRFYAEYARKTGIQILSSDRSQSLLATMLIIIFIAYIFIG